MANTITEGINFNCENIKYSNPKTNPLGGKSVNIFNKSTNSRLNISTPMILTWGASDYVDPNSGKGNGKYEMSLQFPTEEYKTEDLTVFLENMKKFEDKIKSDALTYSKEWFGKVHKAAEVVEALYTPMLKYSKDKNTGEPDMSKPPSLRVKIPVWEGNWRCEVYDDDGQQLFPNTSGQTPVDLIPKATSVAVIMTCGGIWFANGKFGVTWKLIQAMVQKPRAQISGKCFLKTKGPSREDRERSPSPPALHVEPVPETETLDLGSSLVEDSDCDEEDDPVVPVVQQDVSFTTPTSVDPPKKKVVKKKAGKSEM
jgi:hypothetical protein